MAILEAIKIGCQKIQPSQTTEQPTRWLWRDLSFELEPGIQLGLVGATVTGKSLLLRAIACLDPLDEGEIRYLDRPLSAWNLPLYRSQVIYLHQRPIMFEGSVEANLKAVYQLAVNSHRSYDPHRVGDLLETFNRHPEFLYQPAANLSGGESQIVAIIRSLQLEPTVLLLDECTASLDPDTTQKVEKAIASWLAANPQRACIWTSHDPQQIQRVTNQQLILSEYVG